MIMVLIVSSYQTKTQYPFFNMDIRMLLKLVLQGNLSETMEKHYRNGAREITLRIRSATNGLKQEMRRQVKSAGLSTRIANIWRGHIRKKKTASKTTGSVYSNTEKIMSSVEYQTVIHSENGIWNETLLQKILDIIKKYSKLFRQHFLLINT